MNASIVSDGRSRLDEALREKRAFRHAQLLREIETRFEAELANAGFWQRLLLRYRIRKKVAAALRRKFPGAQALFVR